LLDPTALRAVARSVGGSLEDLGPVEDPDPALLDLLEEPYESVGEAATRLDVLESRLRERQDRRSVFLTIYVTMTRSVDARLDESAFEDPEWMERLLVSFADHYRRACYDYERGAIEAVPKPWRVAFGTAVRGDALLLQDAYLGVNAHINYDLAFALEETGLDPNRDQRYRDHRQINDILADLVDVQQDALADVYAPGVADLDAILGRFDELATLQSMVQGREQAWRVAVLRTDFGWGPVPALARSLAELTATGVALGIRSPPLDHPLLQDLRHVEQEGIDLGSTLDEVHARVAEAGRAGSEETD
jgi:hypothetical protein